MKPTKAQRWARKRNWQMGQLLAIKQTLRNAVYTNAEQKLLNKAHMYINEVLASWKHNNKESKQNYLKE